MTTKPTIAAVALLLGAMLLAPAAEAKNCRRICKPLVTRICKGKYSSPRIRRLCIQEGLRELKPICQADPRPNVCHPADA